MSYYGEQGGGKPALLCLPVCGMSLSFTIACTYVGKLWKLERVVGGFYIIDHIRAYINEMIRAQSVVMGKASHKTLLGVSPVFAFCIILVACQNG